MARRHELTEDQWRVVERLLPPSGVKGRPRVDDRRVINAMLYKARTGVAWRDLPERYGPWKTVYNRFWRWTRNGTDSSIVRAHQHAAGARVVHTGGSRVLQRSRRTG